MGWGAGLDELSIPWVRMSCRVGWIIYTLSWDEEQGWMNYLYLKLEWGAGLDELFIPKVGMRSRVPDELSITWVGIRSRVRWFICTLSCIRSRVGWIICTLSWDEKQGWMKYLYLELGWAAGLDEVGRHGFPFQSIQLCDRWVGLF